MLTYFFIWFICYPLSILPMVVLYLLAVPIYLIINYLVCYRRKIILQNLRQSFPEKSDREIRRLKNRYYWHLSQLVVEMIKMLTLPKWMLKYRYYCANPELVNRYYEQGKSVILMSSHYNDWEWMIIALDNMFQHHGVGVGKANSDKVFEKLVNRARTRYGTEVVFADTVRETFARYEENHQPAAYMMLADQSPNDKHRCYVTDFLHQKTGFIYGPEHFARQYDIPVLYYQVVKERLGRYRVELQVITEHPNEEPQYSITQRYTELLAQTIQQEPAYWLWSHRRWKFKF
ncbi:MAG: lysophospholipid acyltransferase family protein [Bacteroidales bacterium]|nr:lysophospholipid acyltransferase family protein [Bacteroidales bacterium]